MLSGWTPAQTIALMLEQRRLSARLALAIGHLDRKWNDLPFHVRLRNSYDSSLTQRRVALRQVLQPEDLESTPLRVDKINRRSEDWLRNIKDADLLALLAYVIEVDLALTPDSAVPGRLRVLRSRHDLPAELGEVIWIVEGPPSLSAELRETLNERRLEAKRRGLTPLELYAPRLADWLTCIRYSHEPIECVDPPPHVQARFDQVWGEAARETSSLEIRLGLFSLRGEFAASFQYTRCLAEQKHGFRALSVIPPQGYLERLDRVIEEASHPEKGVHILLLPELMIDQTGRERLTERLAAMASDPDWKPPLLTVAGSFHFQRDGESTWTNVCTVLDHTGRTLWAQQKRIPFPYRGPAGSWLQDCPAGLGLEESYHEDIEPGQSTVLARSPLGWLAVAICSDLVPASTGGVTSAAKLPADWILIPSMSTTTEQFLEVSRDLARAGKIVCFTNVDPRTMGGGLERRPPDFLDQKLWRPDLAAFVQTPVSHAFGLWFDRPDAPSGPDSGSARVAIPDRGTWEGLIVDLLSVVDAYLTL